MARSRSWTEDDEEHAATVLMSSSMWAQLGEDELTPQVAPERETEPLAVLQAEFAESPLPSPGSVEGSLYGPPPGPAPEPHPTPPPPLAAPRPWWPLVFLGFSALAMTASLIAVWWSM